MKRYLFFVLFVFSGCALHDADSVLFRDYNYRKISEYQSFEDMRHILEVTNGRVTDTIDVVIKDGYYYLPNYGAVHSSRPKSVAFTHFKRGK